MSLALRVDVARHDITTRFTAAVGLLMAGLLALAAREQSFAAAGGGRGWLTLGCAVACAAWCLILCRRGIGRRRLLLRVTADGILRLLERDSGETTDAAVVSAWRLGGLICLRLRPDDPQRPAAFGSGDCLLLLARRSLSQSQWHGLRRWLVWYRRSRRPEAVSA
jgi:hypothetical protein